MSEKDYVNYNHEKCKIIPYLIHEFESIRADYGNVMIIEISIKYFTLKILHTHISRKKSTAKGANNPLNFPHIHSLPAKITQMKMKKNIFERNKLFGTENKNNNGI